MDKSAQKSEGNGAGAAAPPPVAKAPAVKAAVRPRDARQVRFAQSFAQIVAVLMRDANFRKMRLADLEWLVLPPVMAGQFRLAQAPSSTSSRRTGSWATCRSSTSPTRPTSRCCRGSTASVS